MNGVWRTHGRLARTQTGRIVFVSTPSFYIDCGQVEWKVGVVVHGEAPLLSNNDEG